MYLAKDVELRQLVNLVNPLVMLQLISVTVTRLPNILNPKVDQPCETGTTR